MQKKKNKWNGKKRESVTIADPQSPASEQFRRLRANLNFLPSNQRIKSLVVTSPCHGEGKSWIAANLAVMCSQEGKKVLLVDSDMRNPSFHQIFNVQNDIGISSILAGRSKAEAAINKTNIDQLDLLCCGPIPKNPAELLASGEITIFMADVKKNYDMIIFDSPPMLSVVDGQLLANKCDGSVLVINSGTTDRQDAIKAKEALSLSDGNLIGVILNNLSMTGESSYQKN